MPKVIGIVGSRRRDTDHDYNTLLLMFDNVYEKGDWIVSGGCYKGADNMAEHIAHERSIPMIIHKADWDKYRKAAGPIRNTDIANDCNVLIVLCAEDRTGGTEDTVLKVEKQNKPIYHV